MEYLSTPPSLFPATVKRIETNGGAIILAEDPTD
jgi:hypothetical protein